MKLTDLLAKSFRSLSYDQTYTEEPQSDPPSIPNITVLLRERADELQVEVWLLDGAMQRFIGRMEVELPVIDSAITVQYENGMSRASWSPLMEN